jgi:SAM-dependent methyltransferase
MEKLIIGVGQGYSPLPGVTGIDILEDFRPDVVCDIRDGIPFEENRFDEIECKHVLEHIQLNEKYLFVMKEILRVLKPGGTVEIEVPHKDTDSAYESAEHTRFFVRNSFMNFYSNPLAKEMKYPVFELVSLEEPLRNGHKVVWVKMRKPERR